MTDVNNTIQQNIVNQTGNALASETLRRSQVTGASFQTLLNEQLSKNSPLQFSKHAQERVDQRGIKLTEDLMSNLTNAVSKAREKGARDVVIFDASSAFIVNVPNNMVITTITGGEMRENVFTNIDSAVIL
jgi:flagellar operon protein